MTSTEDATGSAREERPCGFGLDDLRGAAATMVGEIRQVPPMVSAVRVGGERLYRAARRGEEVERPARAVTVYGLDVATFDGAGHVLWRKSAGGYRSPGHVLSDQSASTGCVIDVTTRFHPLIVGHREDHTPRFLV